MTDDQAAKATIIETPDDAAIKLPRLDGYLAIAPEWDPQRGRFGYPRRLRYVFFDQGGHVAVAKRYREHARQLGLVKTLAEKRAENPNVDLLVGAVNVWSWDRDQVVKFQLGQAYRFPLWELVCHACVVSQWCWGDYNNNLPGLWDKRDLFNLLYGTLPMFMCDRALWRDQKERFRRSYQNTAPYARAVGYSEMTDHRILTPDRNVQQSAFANGIVITVNFGPTV